MYFKSKKKKVLINVVREIQKNISIKSAALGSHDCQEVNYKDMQSNTDIVYSIFSGMNCMLD